MIIFNIIKMSNKLKESPKVIQVPDSYLHEGYVFAGEEAFYVWGNNTYKDSIIKLLQGEKVMFNADIKNQENIDANVNGMSAIKFFKIWIRFEMNNETKQKQFNEEFHDLYVVDMKMVGNCLTLARHMIEIWSPIR